MSFTPRRVVLPMLLLLFAVGTWADLPADATLETTTQNIFRDIFQSISNIVNQLFADIRYAGSGQSAETAYSFTDLVQKATQNFNQQAQQHVERNGNSVQGYLQENVLNFLSTLRAFRMNVYAQLQSRLNALQRQLLQQLQRQLDELNEAARGLRQLVAALQANLRNLSASYEQATLGTWNSWASEQLQTASQANNGSAAALEQAKQIIDEFVNRYSSLLRACGKELEHELHVYEQRVQKTVGSYQPLLDALIALVGTCLQSGKMAVANVEVAATACEQDPRDLLHRLDAAPGEFARLSAEGRDLLDLHDERQSCVLQTRADFKMELYDVERRVLYGNDCS